jgi:hypothetical protein
MNSPSVLQSTSSIQKRGLGVGWLLLRVLGTLIVLTGILIAINGPASLAPYWFLFVIIGLSMTVYSYYGEMNALKSRSASRAPQLPYTQAPSGKVAGDPAPKASDPAIVGSRYCPKCGTLNPRHNDHCLNCQKALPLPT